MAASITQHSDFLKHKANLYQGHIVRVCLASILLSPNTLPEEVLAAELTNYTRVVTHFYNGAGTYNAANNTLTFPAIVATFTALAQPLEWQSVFVLVGDKVAAIIREIPPIELLPGQSYTYRITLRELLS